MSNTLQTNTFTGGLNLDTDITMVPNNQYRYAENVRVITDTDGSTGVLQNIQDVKLVEGGDFLFYDEKILATTTIDKYGIIITVDDAHVNRIHRVDNYDNPPLEHTIVVKGKLGYTVDSNIKIVANYESEGIIKLYIACPEQIIKTLNIMDDKYVYVSGKENSYLDSAGNLKNPSLLDIQISALLTQPEVTSLGGGQLKTGMVQYSYQLFNARGSSTNFSPVSNAIHLTTSNVSTGQQQYMGANKDINSGKSVNFTVRLNDIPEGLFDSIRLIRIHYSDYTEDPIIEVFQEATISASIKEYSFTDVGGTALNTLTIEEFNKTQESSFAAATIEAKDNILFAANITEATWKPDYDARAYRFTSNGRLILKGASSDQNIDVTLSNSTLNSYLRDIPEDHDCINPYNLTDYAMSAANVTKYKFGTTVLGGTGLNIDYEFITTDITLDEQYQDTLSITTNVTKDNTIRINKLDGSLVETVTLGSASDSRFKNYADPYFASKYRSHHRDEIYRYGIVFFNDKNIATPVYWIGDIKFPHCYEACPWYVDNQSLKGKPIGIRFNVKNYPDGAHTYQIVRCKRTKEDRTVLTQAVVSATVSYPYHSVRDAEYDIASENTRRPYTFLGNSYQKNGFWATFTGFYYKWLLGERVDSSIVTLISPEIDMNKDDMAANIKGCRGDLCMYLDPRTSRMTSRDNEKYYGAYISSDRTQLIVEHTQVSGEMKSQKNDMYPFRAGDLVQSSNDFNNMFIISVDNGTNQIGHQFNGISNMIGKRYVAHYTGLSNNVRGSFDIIEVTNPIIMQTLEWNDAVSKHSSIAGKTYLNASVSHNQDQNNGTNANKTGYFGNCLVINRSNNNIGVPNTISTDMSTSNNLSTKANSGVASAIQQFNYTPFTTPVVNIKTTNIPYGGNTYNARSNSTYISTYSNHIIENESSSYVNVFGGDTYLGILDNKTVIYIPQLTGDKQSPDTYCGISISDYIPFETTINMALMYGQSASRVASGGLDYVDPYLGLTTAGGSYGGHSQEKPYYAYNDAYSVQPDAQMYAVDSTYSISNLKSGNRIRYSGTKTANEITDSWTSFKVADYLDVDSSHGDITNLKNFNDQLLFWQKDAVGIAAVRDRSLITDNDQASLVLGTGGVLDRYDYVTTSNGSDTPNDKSIIGTPSGLYWYDDSKNEVCSYTNQVQKLSKAKSVQSWFNDNSRKAKVSIYDPKFNEVQMGFEGKDLVYNEQLQQFSSFYTFNPDNCLSFPDRLLYIKNQMIQENADFPLNKMRSKLQIIINKDPLLTKTYDNVFFSGEFDDVQEMMQDIKFTTKTQEGTIFRDNTEVSNPIEQREDTYRFAVGREKESKDDMSLPGRMKGKYMICDYLINCDNQRNFKLPNINTTYRYSLV